MRKSVKSYLVFTSSVYRFVMYLLIPLAMIGVAILNGKFIGAGVLIGIAALFTIVETVSDNWLFGGIQNKDAKKMDYLKTSARGMEILQNALLMDLLRKFLSAVIILGGCTLVSLWVSKEGELRNSLNVLMYAVAVSWFFSVLGTFVARYGSMCWFNLMVGYVAMILEIICWFLPGLYQHFPVYILVFIVLGILAGILAVKVAMKKVEGSYYDK